MSLVLCTALMLTALQVPMTAAKDVTPPDGYVIKGVQIRLAEEDAGNTLDVDYRTTFTVRSEISRGAKRCSRSMSKPTRRAWEPRRSTSGQGSRPEPPRTSFY